jgi:hypothetical protein
MYPQYDVLWSNMHLRVILALALFLWVYLHNSNITAKSQTAKSQTVIFVGKGKEPDGEHDRHKGRKHWTRLR